MQQKIEIDNYLTNNYMVDIPMCTYNHEKYIAQTIESILMQKTDFKIRLFIGEDCSIDNTRKIVKQYAEKYPDIIFPVYHNENIGAVRNSEILLKKCTAKYIALLDGDDYWTDPYKLQKQVDFLEKNPEYSLCSHRYKINSWNSDYYSGLFKNS